MKLYQLVACLDEGISYSWLFKSESVWHIAAYVVENYQDYPKIFDLLGLDTYSRYEEEIITADILLNAIGESQIDGDSEYGFEFFEFEENDIKVINNAQLVPTSDYKKWLNPLTGHRNFAYNNFILFQDADYDILFNLIKIKEHYNYDKKNIYIGFKQWLEQGSEINETKRIILNQLIEDNSNTSFDLRSFETLANLVVPLVNLAKINDLRYKVFYDRLLEGKIKETFFKGRVDMCFAKGYNEPVDIDFILHHSSFKGSASPKAALLTQMIVAMLNADTKIMHGVYVGNSHWDFVLIEKDQDNVFNIHYYNGLSGQRLADLETIFQFISAFSKKI